MSERDEERAAAEFVARHFPETTRFVAEERVRSLPEFGPVDVQGGVDELEPAVAVVRVAFALTRAQLVTALAVSFAGIAADRTPESLTVEDVWREVEGQLAADALHELDRQMESDRAAVWPPEQQRAVDVLAAAVDRAYSRPAPSEPQRPVYGDGTVTLATLDRGPVTVAEPSWCLGHEGDSVGYRRDVTHRGEWRPFTVEVRGERVELLQAGLSWAPFAEPHPVVDTNVDGLSGLDADALRELAAGWGLLAGDLYRLANELHRARRWQ